MAEEVKKAKTTKKTEKVEAEEVTKVVTEEPKVKKTVKATAKAGKRSEKGIKEAEEKQAKIERQAEDTPAEDVDDKPKHVQKAPRSKVERRGKKYQEAYKEIDRTKEYTAKEALELAIKTSKTKFDATVELHVRLNVDPKQADQNIRDSVLLPAGTGKTVRVAVFAEEDVAKKAIAAGADVAGNEDFLKSLDKGQFDFEVLIATPNLMNRLAKYARVLGPKGLMPNPKSGTVTNDVEKAVKQAKGGKIEYRVDSTGIVHTGIGKTSFGVDKLQQNLEAVVASIKSNKPASLKGAYVNSVAITTSMGPSVPVQNTVIS